MTYQQDKNKHSMISIGYKRDTIGDNLKGARGFLKPLKHTACGCNTNRKRPSVILRILKYP